MEFSSIVMGVFILLSMVIIISIFAFNKIKQHQPSLISETKNIDETVIFTLSDELDKLDLLKKSDTFSIKDRLKKENEIVSQIRKLG